MNARRNQSERGFTLIELGVIFAIIGVMASLAGPNVIKMRTNLRNKAAVQEILALMRMTRSEAIRTTQRHMMVVKIGSTTSAADDRVTVFANVPTGFDIASLNDAQLKGTAAAPAGMTFMRNADIAKDIGLGPSTGYPRSYTVPYTSIPKSSSCTFCGSGLGAVYFESDGSLLLSDGSLPLSAAGKGGSLVLSPEEDWTSGITERIYAITIVAATGAVRVWK